MHVEVTDRLACRLPVILHHVESVAAQGLHLCLTDLCRQREHPGEIRLRQLGDICEVLLRKNQGMSRIRRIQIQNDPETVILIDGVRRDLPVGNPAENTVFFFHG